MLTFSLPPKAYPNWESDKRLPRLSINNTISSLFEGKLQVNRQSFGSSFWTAENPKFFCLLPKKVWLPFECFWWFSPFNYNFQREQWACLIRAPSSTFQASLSASLEEPTSNPASPNATLILLRLPLNWGRLEQDLITTPSSFICECPTPEKDRKCACQTCHSLTHWQRDFKTLQFVINQAFLGSWHHLHFTEGKKRGPSLLNLPGVKQQASHDNRTPQDVGVSMDMPWVTLYSWLQSSLIFHFCMHMWNGQIHRPFTSSSALSKARFRGLNISLARASTTQAGSSAAYQFWEAEPPIATQKYKADLLLVHFSRQKSRTESCNDLWWMHAQPFLLWGSAFVHS